MEFLRFLESIRTPVGDFFFSVITHLGDETFFLVLAITFFWCISKRQGYYILMTGVVGSVVNQWLKIVCRIPRPWIIDPNFTTVGNATEAAGGYSFPSGHTQNIAGTFGCIGRYNKQKWLKIVAAVVIVLVAFSRMYLGVHTPLDVGVSLVVAAVLVFSFHFIFRTEESCEKYILYAIGGSVLLSIGFILYVFLIPESSFEGEAALKNLMSARDNAATLIGCLFGLFVVYPLDRKYIKFETEGRWYAQLIKLGIGLAVDLAIKSLLKQPLVNLFGMYPGRAVRYFLIVVFSGTVWPLTFKYFKKLRIPFMEKFTEWIVAKFKKNATTEA